MSIQDLIAGNLRSARYALEQGACYGQVLDVNLRHPKRPNGCRARLRIANDPDRVVCRVLNTGKDHEVFSEAARTLLNFITAEMQGWQSRANGCGNGAGKVFWGETAYYPLRPRSANILFADLVNATMEARRACERGSRFRTKGAGRWPSSEMNNGVVPMAWRVSGRGGIVAVSFKDRTIDSSRFMHLADWVCGHIKRHHPDARDLCAQPGIDGSRRLHLEVPSRPTV